MAIGSCSTSTTIHTMVPSRIVWVGLFGEVGSAASGPCASAPFATGPIKVPCRPWLRLQGAPIRQLCVAGASHTHVSRSSDLRHLHSWSFRVFLSSFCGSGNLVGRATVIVNQLREDSKRPILPQRNICFIGLSPPHQTRCGGAAATSAGQERGDNSALVTVTRVSLGTTPAP